MVIAMVDGGGRRRRALQLAIAALGTLGKMGRGSEGALERG
jgi:hypothetical protein